MSHTMCTYLGDKNKKDSFKRAIGDTIYCWNTKKMWHMTKNAWELFTFVRYIFLDLSSGFCKFFCLHIFQQSFFSLRECNLHYKIEGK